MKKLSLLIFMICLTACGGQLTSESLLESMKTTDSTEIKKIITKGVNQSESIDSYTLIMLSGFALKGKDYLNTELFMYKALFRATIDREVFPPIASGGDSPTLALMAMRQNISLALQQAPQKSSEEYQFMIDSIENWKPICGELYHPGWEFKGSPDYDLCKKHFVKVIEKNVNHMKKRAPFYVHPEYFSLLKKWQNMMMQNLYSKAEEMDKEFLEIQNKLIAIESELGVSGEVTKHVELMKNYD